MSLLKGRTRKILCGCGLAYFSIFAGACTIFKKDTAEFREKIPSAVRIKLAKFTDEIEVFSDRSIHAESAGFDRVFENRFSLKEHYKENLSSELKLQFSDEKFRFKDRTYRGSLKIVPILSGGYYAVNVLPIESYLLSVVPSEMPAGWHEEALKTQSVAARTYAVYQMLQNRDREFDMEADVSSQMYLGIRQENSRTTNAVNATKNQVLIHSGKPIVAYYHSHSGGKTASAEEVWGQKLEYAVPRESEYCDLGNKMEWSLSENWDSVSKKLGPLNLGEIRDIRKITDTPSGRADTIEVVGSNSKTEIKGQDFRRMIGFGRLKSLRFEIEKNENGIYFKGKGFGHGVGMSQWGAHGMSLKGFDYREILSYYYTGISLARLDFQE
ncbi:MAG TPA: SpoIID/LytB domain-containing protein [Leptospiraceae bacterium]|nr:SpoIID/LytB domain-containing protein [Leptospiraceae bacterium]HNF14287.1 SpoIID/LytB domain-containing protein [Leptospiraceae bacterium]HNF23670.1 SpoIID/LytB domain-containing protein [Leptospiraceae bacterium]HNI97109.1 SpoIID/LytB domain-containing protein [Leptospiraceae bacterium]HNM05232.1 SpoIID/LytB domain-containing protein [Leptospiraceae bacterium]